MPKSEAPPPSPLLYLKYSHDFERVEWGKILDGPFEITTYLQTIQTEAQALGFGVMVQVATVPQAAIFGPGPDQDKEVENNEQPE